MGFPKDVDALGSIGLKSLWSLLGSILSEKECSLFPVSRAKKEAYYEDKISCGFKFGRVSCLWFGQHCQWSK
jgi:hypothetical protein